MSTYIRNPSARENVGDTMRVLLTTIKTERPQSRLALKYLYSVLADAPIELFTDTYEESVLTSDMYEDIVRGNYGVVYFHADEYNETRILNLAEMVKKAVPTCAVILGGLQVSFDAKRLLKQNPSVDFVIRGEGEKVIFNFIKTLITYEFDFANIPGLAYREDDTIYCNPLEAPVQMEDLPFPYEKINADSGVVYYETIRGTSDRCAYSQFLPDARVRALSLNRVCTELRYFLAKGVDRVQFLDKYFNYNTERAYRIWEYLISNDNGTTSFIFDVNGDNLDEETIRLLNTARPGLFEFRIEVESTNPETLASVGRKENIYQLMYNVSKLLQGNVKVAVTLKIGLPYENEEMFARSFNKIYGLGADTMEVSILRIPKGTAIRQDASVYGYQYNSVPPYEVIASDFMHAPEMIKIRSIVKVLDIYLKNGGFEKSINRILADTGIKPYEMFKKFADYIVENKLRDKMDRKENLYRILYGFAISLYDELNDTLKLQILMEVIHSDLERNLSADAIKKFERKGWEIEG